MAIFGLKLAISITFYSKNVKKTKVFMNVSSFFIKCYRNFAKNIKNDQNLVIFGQKMGKNRKFWQFWANFG